MRWDGINVSKSAHSIPDTETPDARNGLIGKGKWQTRPGMVKDNITAQGHPVMAIFPMKSDDCNALFKFAITDDGVLTEGELAPLFLLEDDFNDGVIDTAKWVSTVTGAGAGQSQLGGFLVQGTLSPDSSNHTILSSVNSFSGNLEMDIGWYNSGGSSEFASRFKISMTDGDIFQIENRFAFSIVASYWSVGSGWQTLGSGGVFGVNHIKVRVKRTGSTIKGFYSEDGGTTWILLGTKTGGSTADFNASIETLSTFYRIHWDNFTLSGGG